MKGGISMDNTLRQEVKLLKAYKNVSYKQLAEQLGIKTKSFYNWLHGEYDFSERTAERLQNVLCGITGD